MHVGKLQPNCLQVFSKCYHAKRVSICLSILTGVSENQIPSPDKNQISSTNTRE